MGPSDAIYEDGGEYYSETVLPDLGVYTGGTNLSWDTDDEIPIGVYSGIDVTMENLSSVRPGRLFIAVDSPVHITREVDSIPEYGSHCELMYYSADFDGKRDSSGMDGRFVGTAREDGMVVVRTVYEDGMPMGSPTTWVPIHVLIPEPHMNLVTTELEVVEGRNVDFIVETNLPCQFDPGLVSSFAKYGLTFDPDTGRAYGTVVKPEDDVGYIIMDGCVSKAYNQNKVSPGTLLSINVERSYPGLVFTSDPITDGVISYV